MASLLPAMTPEAMLDLPWRYVMQLLIEGAKRSKPSDGQTVSAGGGSDELVPCASGGHYPAGYSKLLRIFGK